MEDELNRETEMGSQPTANEGTIANNENAQTEVWNVESDVEPQTENTSKKETCSHKNCFCKYGNWILTGLLLIAVVVLYILHFCCGKPGANEEFVPTPTNAKPGTGEVLYVDIDSINANYLLIEELTKKLDAEMKNQESIFSQKQQDFQRKYAQFQKNYEAGLLTEVQVQNTRAQLQKKKKKLEEDYNRTVSELSDRQYKANQQMLDSVKTV